MPSHRVPSLPLTALVTGVERRMGEAREMLAFIQRVAGGGPAILLGDFNALADSSSAAPTRTKSRRIPATSASTMFSCGAPG